MTPTYFLNNFQNPDFLYAIQKQHYLKIEQLLAIWKLTLPGIQIPIGLLIFLFMYSKYFLNNFLVKTKKVSFWETSPNKFQI